MTALLITCFFFLHSKAEVNSQMNKAFDIFTDLVPFIVDEEKFSERKNDKVVMQKMTELKQVFKNVKHETLLKQDIFAPSLAMVNENIDSSLKAFIEKQKSYSHWRLRELSATCLDCHTRLPVSHVSSFQNDAYKIDSRKYENSYNLGIAQLLVRRYADAKESFIKSIDEKLIRNDIRDLIFPFKQLLLIETKVLKNPTDLGVVLNHYLSRKGLPDEVVQQLKDWKKRLELWEKEKNYQVRNDVDVESFIQKRLDPLKKLSFYDDGYDVDFLIISGVLSNYLFVSPKSILAPKITYWLGWSEKYLKRENFFGSGDLFLKQCIKRYPKDPIAKECFREYKDSVIFEFSGSSGTHLPIDVKQELEELDKLIRSN